VQRWIGQAVAAFAFVAVGILLATYGLPRWQEEPSASGPPPLPTIPIPSTGLADNVDNGIVTVNQPVVRHWDAEQRKWMAVAADDPDADVVITLESVDFNNGEIVLGWALENRGIGTVQMPLVPQNIYIADNARMSYTIDAEQSDPPGTFEVAPGEKARATVIVPQAVRANAITLRIKITHQPFGALWIVNVAQPTTDTN
jgi:hypothetical protein